MSQTKAKPFLKWAGGKTQLLPTIEHFLPADIRQKENVTYIEPFVGGGAVLFYMLQNYPNIKRAVINDINPKLINTYKTIRDTPRELIELLSYLQTSYRGTEGNEAQKQFYLDIRDRFNTGELNNLESAAYMIFLNRTCFNGLYRENSKGSFNVPFGKYVNPTICDVFLLMSDSEMLQRVEILNGDFAQTKDYVGDYTFFYFDPPYRPLDATSSFNSYVKSAFDDEEQIRLKKFYAAMSIEGCQCMLSNSDGKGRNIDDTFMDDLYEDFFTERVFAKRSINANPAKRGQLTELLIRNYAEYQGQAMNLFNQLAND
ncbi:MAG: DNA adenine methylase [Muribaculaceae bacterium]|nr:DNA adenine methylase [Muribaculaceae bacterium]